MNKKSKIFLQMSLAFVFIYFGIDKIVKPELWMGFMPMWMMKMMPFPMAVFMLLNGIFEILIGVLILFKPSVKGAALLMSVFLFFIILSLGINNLTVRDVGLLGASLALLFWEE